MRRHGHHPRHRPRRPASRRTTEHCPALLWEQGHRQRPAGVGRLGPRLAVVAADGPAVHRRARLSRHDDVGVERSTRRTSDTMLKKIGLLVGREWSFPPAFIEEVNRRDAGVTAEFVQLGGTRMDEPCPYAVIIDRISHEVPYYRSYLKHAVLAGRRRSSTTRSCGRPTTSSSARRSPRSSASRSPKTVVLPNKEYVPGHRARREPAQPVYPLDWQRHRRLRRAAVHPQGRPRRRLAGRVRLPLARGADPLLRRVRPADDDRAGVHRVGPVRPLHVPRPGGRAADEVRPARAAVPSSSTSTCAPELRRAHRRRLARRWCARSATT